MGRRRKLEPWQSSIIVRAVRLREELRRNALARRFGVALSTIKRYEEQEHKK